MTSELDRDLREPAWSEDQLRFLFGKIDQARQARVTDVRTDEFLAYLFTLTSLAGFLTREIRGFLIRSAAVEGFSAADTALVPVLLRLEQITLEESRLLKQVLEFRELPARPLDRIDAVGIYEIQIQLETAKSVLDRLRNSPS